MEVRDGPGGPLLAVFGLTKALPTPPGLDMLVSAPDAPLPYTWPMAIADLLGRFATGRIVVEVRTSLPDRPLVRVPLTGRVENWHRATCGD